MSKYGQVIYSEALYGQHETGSAIVQGSGHLTSQAFVERIGLLSLSGGGPVTIQYEAEEPSTAYFHGGGSILTQEKLGFTGVTQLTDGGLTATAAIKGALAQSQMSGVGTLNYNATKQVVHYLIIASGGGSLIAVYFPEYDGSVEVVGGGGVSLGATKQGFSFVDGVLLAPLFSGGGSVNLWGGSKWLFISGGGSVVLEAVLADTLHGAVEVPGGGSIYLDTHAIHWLPGRPQVRECLNRAGTVRFCIKGRGHLKGDTNRDGFVRGRRKIG